MTIVPALDLFVAGIVLIVAVWTVAARDTMSAVVGFVAYGLLLALVWVRLGAPDVALTEAAIGSGLAGALLIGAATRLRAGEPSVSTERLGGAGRVLAMTLSAVVAAAVAVVLLSLPDPAPSLASEAAANAGVTSLGNPVTNVLMAFRAMDTMLEKVVLLLALLGVWSMARDHAWGGRPRSCRRADPEGPLVLLARVLPPVGVVLGISVLWVSADHPGGAFQGATILAAMWLLVLMAGLGDVPAAGGRRLRLVLVAGPAVFLTVGLGGLALGAAFLSYPPAWAKPVILVIEFAMVLTVATTLGLLVAGPPERSAER
ncbi:Na(+)/H(+) antiporter subunit B [Rhodoplanes roseus]|uniref:Sodium:proton antiporter n=1 Tax=Rhodoplanes roseus TaxID=29409 RepID=A0A327KZY0_9BRAD|nr:Na(+)/H(+) antiporter subunit B [Rhodoplanes roseus]RAI43781.1 sodium:proton antiporter [Rhodoplanes roseus]